MTNTPNDLQAIASLAANLMLSLVPSNEIIVLDNHDLLDLIIDFRDDFAGADDDLLADAKIDEPMLHMIADELRRRVA